MKILVGGCSYTYGHGLKNTINDEKLWINQILNVISPKCKIDNIAISGFNNDSIASSVLNRMRYGYDLVVVVWTVIPRFNINIGLELYNTMSKLISDHNINICNKKISKNKLDKIGDSLLELHNDHWDILKVVQYVNVLRDLSNLYGNKIIFVNGLLPFCYDYFNKTEYKYPSELNSYVQDLLQVTERDDNEVKSLYDMIHTHYYENGGINSKLWANLYNSLRNMQVDTVSSTDPHPGYKSQDVYVEALLPDFIECIS